MGRARSKLCFWFFLFFLSFFYLWIFYLYLLWENIKDKKINFFNFCFLDVSKCLWLINYVWFYLWVSNFFVEMNQWKVMCNRCLIWFQRYKLRVESRSNIQCIQIVSEGRGNGHSSRKKAIACRVGTKSSCVVKHWAGNWST